MLSGASVWVFVHFQLVNSIVTYIHHIPSNNQPRCEPARLLNAAVEESIAAFGIRTKTVGQNNFEVEVKCVLRNALRG